MPRIAWPRHRAFSPGQHPRPRRAAPRGKGQILPTPRAPGHRAATLTGGPSPPRPARLRRFPPQSPLLAPQLDGPCFMQGLPAARASSGLDSLFLSRTPSKNEGEIRLPGYGWEIPLQVHKNLIFLAKQNKTKKIGTVPVTTRPLQTMCTPQC